jgi:uncharacterized protein (UPF0248 family)
MQPIYELLSRIRWDEEFGRAQFRIGYYDRLANALIVVDFAALTFTAGNSFSCTLYDQAGELHAIPLHRIRQVFRNGELIWQRPG